MRLPSHILVAPALLLFHVPQLGGADISSLLIAMSASIVTDADHIQLLMQEHDFSWSKIKELNRDIYTNYANNPREAYKDVFYLFHTVEFNLVLFLLSLWYPLLSFVVLGFVFHILCDIVHHRRNGLPILRWLFLWEFLRVKRSS